ncbi:hypothetical protein D3C86_1986160 [compost metagenome]
MRGRQFERGVADLRKLLEVKDCFLYLGIRSLPNRLRKVLSNVAANFMQIVYSGLKKNNLVAHSEPSLSIASI